LKLILRGEELLERAHAVATEIDTRVRQLADPPASVANTDAGPVVSLASRVLHRLLCERR
jgi:hypothetical protein